MKIFNHIIWGLLLIGTCLFGCSRDSDLSVEALNSEALKLARAGQVDSALGKATSALEKSEKENGADHPSTAMIMETLGLVYQAKGDAGKAEASYLRALSIVKKNSGPDNEEAAKIMNNLAGLYYSQKQNSQAATFYKQALAIVEKKFAADDARLAVLRKNIITCEGIQSAGANPQSSENQATVEGTIAEASQARPPVKTQPVNLAQDLVPQQIKDSMITQLAKQNIFISDLEPLIQVPIESKGIVFPYHALKKGKNSDTPQEIVVLFAAVANHRKPNTVVFQQCRVISHTSYLSALQKGGSNLKKEIQEVFRDLYL